MAASQALPKHFPYLFQWEVEGEEEGRFDQG